MIHKLKSSLRKLTPKSALDNFHYIESLFYTKKHQSPSQSMIIIGIVGSKGKTTTANMLWSVLTATGYKTGQIGTANIRIADREKPNPWHMTMPGAKRMQHLLSQMKQAGCTHVVMEVPSEAQTQWRHVGIAFDVIIFTGVEKEIMAAHNNSMQVLHKHNQRVLKQTDNQKPKVLFGKTVHKLLVLNVDNAHVNIYKEYLQEQQVTYSIHKPSDFQAQDFSVTTKGTELRVAGTRYATPLIGEVNALNAAAVVATATTLGISSSKIAKGLKSLQTIPGRMEPIDEGQDFSVYVDYAHDQISLTKLLETGRQLIKKPHKLIVHIGGQGGGRDITKRAEMGSIAAKLADIVIVSDDDPYDDPPMQIIEDIAQGAMKNGKKEGKDLFLIQDRRAGIHQALSLADKGDLVFIACKGADQLMMLSGGKSIPWDDRKVTREELKKIL